jgi:hypothetical protein
MPIIGLFKVVILALIIGLSIDVSNTNRGIYGVITDLKSKFVTPIIYDDYKPVTLKCLIGFDLPGLLIGFISSRLRLRNTEKTIADEKW